MELTVQGYSEIDVKLNPKETESSSSEPLTLAEQLEEHLKKTMEAKELYWVHNTSKFAAEFLKFEEKHPQVSWEYFVVSCFVKINENSLSGGKQ